MAYPAYYKNRGQALLIIVLVMAVALTVGLSVIARSITDIAISQKEEEAARAFSAAEAGVEQALIASCPSFPCNPTTPTIGTGQVDSLLVDTLLTSNSKAFVHPQALPAGESASIWLVGHDENNELACSWDYPCFVSNQNIGQLQFCWGRPGTASSSLTTPALEIMIFYTTSTGYSNTKVARAVFDPNSSRRDENGFAAPDAGGCTISGQDFQFAKTRTLNTLGVNNRNLVTDSTGPQLIRARLFYNSDQTHPIGLNADFSGNGALPQQGTKILSTGTSGNATRKLEVYKLYSDLPSIFDYGVFSGTGGIVKEIKKLKFKM